MRSLLGLANYFNKFIPDLATIVEPLRDLTKKETRFEWNNAHEAAFQSIKNKLASANTLGFFDPDDKTLVIADASPIGLGAALLQENFKGDTRIICFASKSLTDTEKRYCQTEKEALAVVWSVERFRMYIYDRPFNLMTDWSICSHHVQNRARGLRDGYCDCRHLIIK